MKLKSLLALTAAGLMLTACSSDEPQKAPVVSGEGENMMAISLNVPEGVGTRATGTITDSYDDGSEYSVNDLNIIIYQKIGSDYKCVQVIPVTPATFDLPGSTTEQTTAGKNIIVRTNIEKDSTGEYYAFAIVNKGNITIPEEGDSFSTFNDMVLDATEISRTGFLMVNSLKDNAGTLGVLERIDTSKIVQAATEPASIANAAATIYVERAAVKASVATFSPTVPTGASAALLGWALDVKGNKFYLVHRNDYAFGSNAWFKGPHRINWAKTDRITTWSSLAAGDFTADAAKYCVENCPAYAQMTQNRTTRIVMKVRFVPADIVDTYTAGDDFYKYNGKYYTKAALGTLIGKTDAQIDAFTWTNNVAAVEGVGNVTRYEGGASYYVARLRNFNDTNAPLPGSWDGKVGSYTAAQTGRYGVVRNNWYEVNVTAINKVGTPDLPPAPSTESDDPIVEETENYIEYTVNILKWYKHVQNESY